MAIKRVSGNSGDIFNMFLLKDKIPHRNYYEVFKKIKEAVK